MAPLAASCFGLSDCRRLGAEGNTWSRSSLAGLCPTILIWTCQVLPADLFGLASGTFYYVGIPRCFPWCCLHSFFSQQTGCSSSPSSHSLPQKQKQNKASLHQNPSCCLYNTNQIDKSWCHLAVMYHTAFKYILCRAQRLTLRESEFLSLFFLWFKQASVVISVQWWKYLCGKYAIPSIDMHTVPKFVAIAGVCAISWEE